MLPSTATAVYISVLHTVCSISFRCISRELLLACLSSRALHICRIANPVQVNNGGRKGLVSNSSERYAPSVGQLMSLGFDTVTVESGLRFLRRLNCAHFKTLPRAQSCRDPNIRATCGIDRVSIRN